MNSWVGRVAAGYDDENEDRAWWARCVREVMGSALPEDRIHRFLAYLEQFPVGMHNRRAAEAVEQLLYLVGDDRRRTKLHNRFRAIRDRFLPALEADTWDPKTWDHQDK